MDPTFLIPEDPEQEIEACPWCFTGKPGCLYCGGGGYVPLFTYKVTLRESRAFQILKAPDAIEACNRAGWRMGDCIIKKIGG